MRPSGEGSRLLRREAAGGISAALRWRAPDGPVGQTYPAVIPWDVLCMFILLAPMLLVTAVSPVLALWALGSSSSRDGGSRYLSGLPGALHWVAFLAVTAFLGALALVPRRVAREPDALRIDFPLHSRRVPLGEVLELEVLGLGGLCSFLDLLAKWRIFPFGLTLRCFAGLPSSQGVVFVLLTARCFWSYVFCLEDPVQFLVDNQKPLDLGARYRVLSKVLVREGESFKSAQVTNVSCGCSLRVEEQRGRRVRVTFGAEVSRMAWPKVQVDGELEGWISYVSTIGRFLLEKERDGDCPLPGTVGASSFNGSYGTAAIELPSVAGGGPGRRAPKADEPE